MKRTAALLLMMALAFTLWGCQGDWRYDLVDGYAITRVNSRHICLLHYETEDGSGRYVIEKFFVTDFCRSQNFIGLQGIPTADIFATEEELTKTERCFYIVDINGEIIHGPYADREEFVTRWAGLSGDVLPDWTSTEEMPKGAQS